MGLVHDRLNAIRRNAAEYKEAKEAERIAAATMNMADANERLAEVFAGLRRSFVAKGFTEEQAGDMVVAIQQESAANAAAIANALAED